MRHTLSTAFALLASVLAVGAGAQEAPTGATLTPIRPPAVPLIVRQPYVSAWQPANTLTGHWSKFWAGHDQAFSGLARIDGKTYTFMGAPVIAGKPFAPPMTQTALRVTPTQSQYTLQGGGVTLSLDFLSPVELTDLRRQSVPLSYVFATAASADGKPHAVRLDFDISGQWADGDDNAPIAWQRQIVPDPAGPLAIWNVTPSQPKVLGEAGDAPTWGQAVWATRARPGLTTQAGEDAIVRATFVNSGVLDNSVDADQPRAINSRWPVFAFDFDLGSVGKRGGSPVVLTLGDVRNPAVSYQGQPVPPLWLSYWPTWQAMTAAFTDDAPAARARADTLDRRITQDATKAGGPKYAALCALALRQAFGATEMVGTARKPWMFMKEISSDGNISTVHIMYPAFPVFLYANPSLLRLQMDPLFDYAESGKWPQPFAEHDIGASYPRADGHNDGGGENMPVEELANMLIMAAAYLRYAPKADAAAYARQHYRILKQWADYLLSTPKGGTAPNALDPEFQNQTDDFTGPIAHSVNLALKGILGVGAMGQIADYAGNTSDKARYAAAAKSMIGEWARRGQSKTGPHMTMQYIEADTPQPATWTSGVVGPHALALQGAGGAEAPTPVVDTTKSYTVAAWVRPGSVNGYQTYVSIDGRQASGFFLQIEGSGKFAFSALPRDAVEAGVAARAELHDAAAAGSWYQLTGVYDADARTLSLYVNGALQRTVPYTTAFRAGGPTVIGRGLFGGNKGDFVTGAVDDVRFYQSALSAGDIAALAAKTAPAVPAPAAYWTFDEGTGTTAADASGNGHLLTMKTNGPDANAAWSLKYNAFPDKILGLNLVPKSVLVEEARYYLTKRNAFGIPLDIRHTYTKDDWELWTAASTDDAPLRQAFIDGVYRFADTSNARIPFSDWYDTVSGQQTGFQARPAIGGLFAVLDRTALKPNR